jgi:hypothetical protein
MISIKTKMIKLPTSCSKCNYYSAQGVNTYERVCLARGKDKPLKDDIKPYVERDNNCPLIEE